MSWIKSLFLALVPLVASGPMIGQDPQAPAGDAPTSAAEFDARLRKNPFFQKILWTTDSTYAPFDILIQKQAVPEPDFERSVALFYGPWMQQIAKVFEETVATPAKLEPGIDPRPIRLIVLLTEGDYLNYSKTKHTLDGFGARAFYDDRFRAVVTFWDVPGPANLKRYPVLRRFVFALMHQRSSAVSGRQAPLWLREGLSAAIAWHIGADPASAFAKPLIDPKLVEELVRISQDDSRKNVYLLPLRSLATVLSTNDLWKRLQSAADEAEATLGENDPWFSGYFDQSVLWVHFLRREGATAHNRAFENYLRLGMRGGGSATDLEQAFPGQDLAALDQEFFRWAYARAREGGKITPDESKLATLFPKPLHGDASAAAGDSSLATTLAPPAGDVRVDHALALRKASRGDIEGALADLAKRVETANDDPAVPGMRKEIERLTAWKVARDAWIADLVANAGRLQLDRDGKKLTFKVTRTENGMLELESAKGKENLPVGALEPAAVAGQMKATPASSPEWVRAYAMLLCADARFDKLLKDKSPESQALRADAAGPYVELKLLGIAAEHLAMLAQNASPADAVAAISVLDRLHRVRLEVPTQPLILQRIDALRSLARAAASKVFDETHPQPELGGKANWIDASTIELTYDFDSASEIDDWTERPDAFKGWRSKMEQIEIPEAERKFQVAGGVWAGRGAFVFRHVLPLEAPLYIHAVVRHGGAANDSVDVGHFLFRVCDDGDDNYIAAAEGGEILVYDDKTGIHVAAPASQIFYPSLGPNIELELTHDGQKVHWIHDGVTEADQAVGSRRSGGLYVIVHTNRDLIIESIKIRGKLGAEALKVLRERWISNAVMKTGLM